MIEVKNKMECCGCHACFNVCPVNAIEMKEDEKGFKYPIIDKEKCVNCGLCDKVCPIKEKVCISNEPVAYAAYNKDEEIRKESSSGGIFTLLAEKILEKQGIVFGAIFDDNFHVIHTYIDSKKQLEKLRGSKYVQSTIGDCYKIAKQYLEEDKYVLFTGTPCQIEGLRSYLQKDYKKLYTQDIICHGVPSPKVWEKYMEYRKNKDKEIPQKIYFRNKDNGWKRYNVKFKYKQGEYKNRQSKDVYMQAFLRDISLRDSCYHCNFKKKNRRSDITIADFWGIEEILPQLDDDKGISLIIVNSKKGQELLNDIKNEIIAKKVNFEEAIKYNPSMLHSVNTTPNREEFFEKMNTMEFNKLVEKYTKGTSIPRKVIRKLKKIIKRKRNK